MFAIMTALALALPAWQDGASSDTTSTPTAQKSAAEQPSPSPSAEQLRGRVHKLRMDLILGGDQVQRAESEAIDFYTERAEVIDRRLDRIDVDLSEKKASYQLALDRTLRSPRGQGSAGPIREATRLRSEIKSLEGEGARLRKKRSELERMIRGISDRGMEREALAANLEANNVVDMGGGLPMSSIGFGPGDSDSVAGSPFDDPDLVKELVALDPRRGRAALFDADPTGYWNFFTLQPPATPLRAALEFPLPDLPGTR